MVQEEPMLLTVPEAALRLGVGRSFLYYLVMSGEIQSIKLGRSRRIPVEALGRFIDVRLAGKGDAEKPSRGAMRMRAWQAKKNG